MGWALHDQLFANPKRRTRDDLIAYGLAVGAAGEPLSRCLDRRDVQRVNDDVALARALGITGTPSFVVGRVIPGQQVLPSAIVVGARPIEHFRTILRDLLD